MSVIGSSVLVDVGARTLVGRADDRMTLGHGPREVPGHLPLTRTGDGASRRRARAPPLRGRAGARITLGHGPREVPGPLPFTRTGYSASRLDGQHQQPQPPAGPGGAAVRPPGAARTAPAA